MGVLDLNDGENNDKSPTTWEVALESKMKTLQGRLRVVGSRCDGRGPCHGGGAMSIRR